MRGRMMDNDDRFDASTLGNLAHRMNNAAAYTLTNLNVLGEEIEQLPLDPAARARLMQLVEEATDGASRIGDHIRELKVLSWGEQGTTELSGEDTWGASDTPSRILVIDDEPYILASIRRALSHYDVVLADGGQAAIDMLSKDGQFDLVLCDLIMGHVPGTAVYSWIETHRPDLLSRVILMTAGVFTGTVREFLARTHNPVLHKPFDTKTLRWMIAQALRSEAKLP